MTDQRPSNTNRHESAEDLHGLVESTLAVPWQASAITWQFTYVGPQAVRLLGYPVEDWFQRDFWFEHLHPDDRESAAEFCMISSRTLKDYEFEYRMISSDRKVIWIHDIVSVEFEDGVPVTLRGFMIDITRRKQNEAQLKHYRTHLETQIKVRTDELERANQRLSRDLLEQNRSRALIHQHMKRLEILRKITLSVTSTLDLKAVLDNLLDQIDELLPYAATTVRLRNRETGEFEAVACRNIETYGYKVDASKGLLRKMIETRGPVISSDVQHDRQVGDPGFFREHGVVSFLTVPLIAGQEVLGTISFYTKHPCEFIDEEVEFLFSLATQVALAIHNSTLFGEVQRRSQELSALYSVTSAVSKSLELDQVLSEVMRKIRGVFMFDATRIYLLDSEKHGLVMAASFEATPKFSPPSSRPFQRKEGIVGKVVESGQPLIFENILEDPRYLNLSYTKAGLESGHLFFAAIPIQTKTATVGSVVCVGEKPRHLSARELRLITSMADHIGIALENSQLYERTKRQAAELADDIKRIKALERQQAESEKLAATGRMAARVAHEINNPLAGIKNSFDLIKEAIPEDYPYFPYVGRIEREIDRIAGVVRHMYNLYRQDQESPCKCVVNDTIQDIVALLEVNARQRNVSVVYENGSVVMGTLREGLLRHILYNVIQNAIEASSDGATVKVDSAVIRGVLKISVTDRGAGIADDIKHRIFEPFFTTKKNAPRAGLGLGLSITKSMVETMGGSLEFKSEVALGSVFEISLPLAQARKRGDQ